jgi:hypothetical protein
VDFRYGSCCVTCGLPQMAFGENIHGNIETGECEEGLKDLVKGCCWGIFRDQGLREKYLVNVFNGDERRFKDWMKEMDESREMTNGVSLMLMVWREMLIYI